MKKLSELRVRDYIGLAGVNRRENLVARQWGKAFEFAMILVAIWIPFQWYLQRKTHLSLTQASISSWVVWAFLMFETVTLLCLVKRKAVYLRHNWMNWIIIIAAFPPLTSHTSWLAGLRSLQLLIMLRILLPGWYSMVDILSRNRLGTTLIVALIVTVLWGVLLSAVDPGIHNPGDGIWWAWQTVTTVGYGDVVPVTNLGRFLGGILMLMGVALISLLTANFSAYFISKGTREIKEEEDEILALLKEVKSELTQVHTRLTTIEEKDKVGR